ncbi:MAG: dockerin type I repeat-containing protein [Phycisphaerales bacterium]|jgi:hypothetical protein
MRSRRQPPLQATTAIAGILLAAVAAGPCLADSYKVSFPSPTLDRWNYPFNPTPGTRISASTFGNEPGGTMFDNRDGQFIVGFDTGATVPSGLGAANYAITSCTVEITYSNDFVVEYDPTVDPFTAFLPETDPEYADDADPGQPIELYGVGFRGGFSLANWTEFSPYTAGDLLAPSVRNAFALGTNASGAWVDVSNSVRERWTPTPFAVGTIDGLKPGSLVPINTVMRFDLDVGRADVQAYLRAALDAGKLRLTACSLTKVVQQGGNFPTFYCRENPIVTITGIGGATLAMTVETQACAQADLDCDGIVNAQDLAILLVQWGSAGSADLNGDGTVGAADLAALLDQWG